MLDYDIAFLKHDPVAMQRAAARARGRSGGDNWISAREASALAYSGRLQQARNLTERAATQAREAGQQERGGL